MRKRSVKYILLISILLLSVLPPTATWSCGPELGTDETMFLLFQKNMPQQPGLESFYYTQGFLNGEVIDPAKTDWYRNCAEWRQFANNKVSIKDVYNIQYNLAPDELAYAYKSGTWGSLGDNTFIQWLRQAPNKAALEYMLFAKKIEFLQAESLNPWSKQEYGGHYVENIAQYDPLINEALKKCDSALPVFLQQRYAFQAIKLLRGMRVADAAVDTAGYLKYRHAIPYYYERYLKDKPTIAADWGLVYYAVGLPDKEQALLAYVHAFDRTEEKKVLVFEEAKVKDLNELEHHVKDKQTLAAIMAIKAMKNKGRALNELQQLYKLQPASPYLKLLIGREVNKLEDWLLSPEMKGFNTTTGEYTKWQQRQTIDYTAKNRLKDIAYLADCRSMLLKMLQTGYAEKDFTKLAIVRLYHIEKNFAAASDYLKTIGPQANEIMEIQRQTELAVSALYTNDLMLASTQDKLAKIFSAIERRIVPTATKAEWEPREHGTGKDVLSALYLLGSRRYEAAGATVFAGLLFQKADLLVNDYYGTYYHQNVVDGSYSYGRIDYFDKYATVHHIDELLTLKHKQHKTPFEQKISPAIWADDDVYYDLKATLLIRAGKFDSSLAVLNKVQDSFWARTPDFTDNLSKINITSLGTVLPMVHGAGSKYSGISKKAMVADIVAQQRVLDTAQSKSVRANAYFLLANCMFNMTYWGRDWMLYSYGRSVWELNSSYYNYESSNYKWASFTFTPGTPGRDKVYYECSNAIDLYQKALALAKDDKELSAECALMLMRCDNMRHMYLTVKQGKVDRWEYEREKAGYVFTYFRLFKSKYATTMTFHNSITECPDVEALNKRIH